jgi:hypothetical protein
MNEGVLILYLFFHLSFLSVISVFSVFSVAAFSPPYNLCDIIQADFSRKCEKYLDGA